MQKTKRVGKNTGFTLIELLVVIAIIGILSSIVLATLNKTRDRAQVTKIFADVNEIRRSWTLWQIDTNSNFISETAFSGGNPTNPDYPCYDEPSISQTDLLTDVMGILGWDGPYLKHIPVPPFGIEYMYDYDNDTSSSPYGGVYTMIGWCDASSGTKYMEMIPALDQLFDHGDGKISGRFRWDGTAAWGHLDFLIE